MQVCSNRLIIYFRYSTTILSSLTRFVIVTRFRNNFLFENENITVWLDSLWLVEFTQRIRPERWSASHTFCRRCCSCSWWAPLGSEERQCSAWQPTLGLLLVLVEQRSSASASRRLRSPWRSCHKSKLASSCLYDFPWQTVGLVLAVVQTESSNKWIANSIMIMASIILKYLTFILFKFSFRFQKSKASWNRNGNLIQFFWKIFLCKIVAKSCPFISCFSSTMTSQS